MSDDPARALAEASAAESAPVAEAQVVARPWVQLTDAAAGPVNAGEVLETSDALGRVPVVVRIRRQPPIRIEWVIVAIALGASGLLLPLFLALRAVIIVMAIAALVVGFMSRIFLRIPPGSVGLVTRSGRYQRTYENGIQRVNPLLVLTHVITTRELAFDVPVTEVRSSDGVGVSVDLMLTLGINDHAKLVYGITMGDLDQVIHATAQDAVRTIVRGIAAMDALDLGESAAERIRTTVEARLASFGVGVRAVTFTRVTLPTALTASLEARRLAAVQLAEQEENHLLDQRRVTDRAELIAQEQASRQHAIELEAAAEALRLGELDDRLSKYPKAALYDLETGRLRVAQQLAGNSRAVVSMGGGDLVSALLTAREAGHDPGA